MAINGTAPSDVQDIILTINHKFFTNKPEIPRVCLAHAVRLPRRTSGRAKPVAGISFVTPSARCGC